MATSHPVTTDRLDAVHGRVTTVAISALEPPTVHITATVIPSRCPGTEVTTWPHSSRDRHHATMLDRVRAAVRNGGYTWPDAATTLAMAPPAGAMSTAHDLATAAAVLTATDQMPPLPDTVTVIGELALDGTLRRPRGTLACVRAARGHGARTIIVPRAALDEAMLVGDVDLVAVAHLDELVRYARGHRSATATATAAQLEDNRSLRTLTRIRFAPRVRRALHAAAVGGHHLLVTGEDIPAVLASVRTMAALLPSLTHQEALDLAAIRSFSTAALTEPLQAAPPYVRPHHSSSLASLVGSVTAGPGAASSATSGLLHVHDPDQWPRSWWDTLRTMLDHQCVRIAGYGSTVTYPAQFQLAVSAQPGHRHLPSILVDRIPIRLHLSPDDYHTVTTVGDPSWILAARATVTDRARATAAHVATSYTPRSERLAQLQHDGAVTARGATQLRQLAATLASLDRHDGPNAAHIEEAIALRAPAR